MTATLRARHTAFPLHTPFRISRGTKSVADVVTVIVSAAGKTGRGEGVPYPRYGETIDGALADIRRVAPAVEAALSASGADAAHTELQQWLPAGAARNAIDCALWDLQSQLDGTPVAQRTGLSPDRLPTAMTVVIDTPERMEEAARALAHVPLLKAKVDNQAPDAQIRAVRRGAPGPRLIVDPNESWTIDTLRTLAPLLVEEGVTLLEQPLPANDDAALDGYRSPVPLAADEALHTRADLVRVARRYQVANIKLDKTGGLTEALALRRDALAAGMGLMVGCMISSSLSIAPAMLLAAGAAFADLDGPLWLADDMAGGVRERDGWLLPPAPGFWGAPPS